MPRYDLERAPRLLPRVLRTPGSPHRRQLAPRAPRGPHAALHQRGDEPVQGPVPRPRAARLRRATTSQKCMRVSGKHNDLDNVGPSLRHHTFFEMLGNFSFGDYFKPDAIQFAWQLLTDVWELPARPAATPRSSRARTASRATTRRTRSGGSSLPADASRARRDDNFWQMGDTGPCGRCSEIHYFRGNHLPCPGPCASASAATATATSRSGTTCSWSSTASADGTLMPLPAPSIDTGMGLERITAVMQGTLSNYDTDLFTPLLGRDRRDRRARRTATARMSPTTSRCASSPTTCAR